MTKKKPTADRAHANQAGHALESKYRSLYQIISDAVISVDMDGRIDEFNEAYAAMLGYEPEELHELRYTDLTPEKWHSSEKAIVEKQVLVRGYSDVYEKEYRRKSGEVFPVELKTSLIRGSDGSPVGMWAIVRDITERKRAEEELFRSQQMLQLVLDTIPQRVFWKDRNGKYLGCNVPFAKDDGYDDPSEIIGKNDHQLFPEAVADSYTSDDRKVIKTGTPRLNYGEPYIKPDGTECWLKTSKVPLRDREGAIIGMLGTYDDITHQKEVEKELRDARDSLERRVQERTAELRASEERFRSLLEHSNDRIGMLDSNGKIIYASPSSKHIYGYTPEELLGRNAFEFIHPDDLQGCMGQFAELVGRPGALMSTEYRARHKDGHYVWMEVLAWNALFNPAVNAFVLNERDVTLRRQKEQEVKSLSEKLKERAEKLETANLQLRQEMRKRRHLEEQILSISEAEQRRLGQDLHDDLGQQLTGMSMLSKSLASDLASEEHARAKQAVDLAALLQASIRTARTLAKGFYPIELMQGGFIVALKDLAQGVQLVSGVRCKVRHDEAFQVNSGHALHLYRIVQEALNNAVKHGRPTRIVIECSVARGVPTLTVTDDGVGLKKIQSKSRGMGLHLFNYRARLIGAKIEVQNANGGGCRVTCSFEKTKRGNLVARR